MMITVRSCPTEGGFNGGDQEESRAVLMQFMPVGRAKNWLAAFDEVVGFRSTNELELKLVPASGTPIWYFPRGVTVAKFQRISASCYSWLKT